MKINMFKNKKITKEQALDIAEKELKNSFYKEEKEKGTIYSYLRFDLEVKEKLTKYYIYVVGGRFGITEEINGITEHSDGIFSDKLNISCTINKRTGEYKYMK